MVFLWEIYYQYGQLVILFTKKLCSLVVLILKKVLLKIPPHLIK